MIRDALPRSLALVAMSALSACASGPARPGSVTLEAPEPADGDEAAIVWPFVVTHTGGSEIVADFHLRIEEGGTLVGVRPDAQNPDTDATLHWRGEVRNGEGYWIGNVLPRGSSVRLWALVRAVPGGEPRLRVIHWPTDGRDQPVAEQQCEIWSYDTRSRETDREPC
jgi:hypothetical protein